MIDSWLMGSFSHTQRAAITTLTTLSDSMVWLSERSILGIWQGTIYSDLTHCQRTISTLCSICLYGGGPTVFNRATGTFCVSFFWVLAEVFI